MKKKCYVLLYCDKSPDTINNSHTFLINNLKNILLEHFPNAKIAYEKRDRLMPKRGTLSIAKAKKLLNYNPSFSIEEAYPDYINWYKEFLSK